MRRVPSAQPVAALQPLHLTHSHVAGIVHRDVKLENCLLLNDSPDELHIKLADFGLAKDFTGKDPLLTLCGSPQYVAPEIISTQRTRRVRAGAVPFLSGKQATYPHKNCGGICRLCARCWPTA